MEFQETRIDAKFTKIKFKLFCTETLRVHLIDHIPSIPE